VTLTADALEGEMRQPAGRRELLARFRRPAGPDGEYREIDPIVRRQHGGSFRSESSP